MGGRDWGMCKETRMLVEKRSQRGGGKIARGRRRRVALAEALEPRRLLSAVWYVDVNAPGPTHNGTSWTNAFTNIQQAPAAAGDTIRVAGGTYKPTNTLDRSISFHVP